MTTKNMTTVTIMKTMNVNVVTVCSKIKDEMRRMSMCI